MTGWNIDAETAVKLFDHAAKLLVLGLPEGLEFGIDCNTWAVGDRFKGVKFIPPGLHFFYFSCTSNTGGQHSSLIRSGCFYHFNEYDVVVRKYDPVTEDLCVLTDIGQLKRYQDNIRDFDKYMGPYPLNDGQSYSKWQRLTSHISSVLISRILPNNGSVTSMSGSYLTSSDPSSHNITDTNLEDNIHFNAFDLNRSWPQDAVGTALTRYSRDKSWLLGHLLESKWNADYKELIGEIQLAFVLLLFGHNFEGLEQWKRLLTLLCSCDELFDLTVTIAYWDQLSIGKLYLLLFDVLEHQMQECPQDFFTDIILESNFLAHTLKRLITNINQSAYQLSESKNSDMTKLIERIDSFCMFIKKRFRMELSIIIDNSNDEDAEDDQPVVVEL